MREPNRSEFEYYLQPSLLNNTKSKPSEVVYTGASVAFDGNCHAADIIRFDSIYAIRLNSRPMGELNEPDCPVPTHRVLDNTGKLFLDSAVMTLLVLPQDLIWSVEYADRVRDPGFYVKNRV